MLLVDDLVGVSDSEDQLQKLMYVVHVNCCKWGFKGQCK